MLPATYRFVVLNETGAALTGLTCTCKNWKLASDGSITYSAESTISGLNTTLADDAADASDTIDNSSDKYVGTHCVWSITVGSAQSSVASIYLQGSTDGGTDWPSIANLTVDEIEGQLLDVIKLNSETTRSGYFEI